jgi:hypothetical protein
MGAYNPPVGTDAPQTPIGIGATQTDRIRPTIRVQGLNPSQPERPACRGDSSLPVLSKKAALYSMTQTDPETPIGRGDGESSER